ncbi:TolC family protein [Undibacterium sp. Jales W-56]|uniref:TolC family protein n=1 Tax=Undibacterium sp. Jales W-56 TaxID=2897325 RepID=UPI0021D0354F|nr:TolC family protein [Undibacterium sp. Jales W-56]MCU6435484.1 TolC family protein [Undibacterium sp. Jales W-56]
MMTYCLTRRSWKIIALLGAAHIAADAVAQTNSVTEANFNASPKIVVSNDQPGLHDHELMPSLSQLTLAQAVKLALQNNHDLRSAQIAIGNAEAMTTIAGAAPNPTLTLQTVGINPALGIGPGNLKQKTVDSTIRVDQLIERGGKRELRLASAGHLEKASRLDWIDARRQTQQAASAAYFDLIAAQHKLRIARETAGLFQVTLVAAGKRKSIGDIAGADVARLRVDALRAENDARLASADLLRAKMNLTLMLGLKIQPDSVQAIDEWPEQRIPALNNEMEKLLQQRPNILAAKARLDAAVAARKLAIASRTRDVSVGLQFEHYPTSPGNTQGSGNSYGVALQIPLFTRYEFQGEIRAAEIAVDAAQENLNKHIDAARSEIAVVIESAQASEELLRRFKMDLLPAAKHSADAAEFAFKNGAIGVMDVLDARRIYRATEMDAINAQTEFAKAFTTLRIYAQEMNDK